MKFRVCEVMTRNVETVSPANTLEAAAQKMTARNVGILPVVDGDKLVGVVTDRDIVLRAVAQRLRPEMTRVRDVMTSTAICAYEDQNLSDVSLLMERNLVHRLIVLDRGDKLVGVVSLSDIAAKTKNEALSGHVLGKVVAA